MRSRSLCHSRLTECSPTDGTLRRRRSNGHILRWLLCGNVVTNGFETDRKHLSVTSPNRNGQCALFIQTIKLECLDKFIVFGKRHLDHLVTEFVEYYNTTRSSMVRGHLPPIDSRGAR